MIKSNLDRPCSDLLVCPTAFRRVSRLKFARIAKAVELKAAADKDSGRPSQAGQKGRCYPIGTLLGYISKPVLGF